MYTSVETWVHDQLIANHEEEDELVRFTVRLTLGAHSDLLRLAEHLGKSKSSIANGLLEAAIGQALFVLTHPQLVEVAE